MSHRSPLRASGARGRLCGSFCYQQNLPYLMRRQEHKVINTSDAKPGVYSPKGLLLMISYFPISRKRPKGASDLKPAFILSSDNEFKMTSTPRPLVVRRMSSSKFASRELRMLPFGMVGNCFSMNSRLDLIRMIRTISKLRH